MIYQWTYPSQNYYYSANSFACPWPYLVLSCGFNFLVICSKFMLFRSLKVLKLIFHGVRAWTNIHIQFSSWNMKSFMTDNFIQKLSDTNRVIHLELNNKWRNSANCLESGNWFFHEFKNPEHSNLNKSLSTCNHAIIFYPWTIQDLDSQVFPNLHSQLISVPSVYESESHPRFGISRNILKATSIIPLFLQRLKSKH